MKSPGSEGGILDLCFLIFLLLLISSYPAMVGYILLARWKLEHPVKGRVKNSEVLEAEPMKIERVSDHIWSLVSWVFFPVRVWVVVESDGITLVDARMPFMAKGILTFIDRLGAGPLQRILLTHGHSDHVGSIKSILDKGPVPVYAVEPLAVGKK